jgi:hypothetical protein
MMTTIMSTDAPWTVCTLALAVRVAAGDRDTHEAFRAALAAVLRGER